MSQAQPPPPSTGLSTGGIVAISIVLSVGAALVLAGLLWMRRRKRRAQAAAGGLEAAKQKHNQERLPPGPVNSPSNPAELGGGGVQDLRPPLPPRPHRESARAPPSLGHYAPVERHDAGGSASPRQQQTVSNLATSAPPEPHHDRQNQAVRQQPPPVSGPVEMQAEDWPRPTGVILPPEQKSIPREVSATRPQQDRALLEK